MRARCRAFLLLGCTLLAGCGVLKRAPAEKSYFVLEATRPDAQIPSPDGEILYLRTLRVSPVYEGQSFVYLLQDGTWERDFHNEFFVLPDHLLTGEVRECLSGSGFIRRVTRTVAVDEGLHALNGNVEALYGDYSGDTPMAVLAIEFVVLRSVETVEVLFDRNYRKEVPISRGAHALVSGWNEALAAILAEFEEDLRQVDFTVP